MLFRSELNRTSAKTQAALLEAMAEGKVSVDGITYSLPQPFFVVATQNPQEFHGVYPLSESQLDRFTMHINLAFPPEEAELEVYRQHGASSTRALEATEALASEELIAIRAQVARVFVEDSLIRYAQSIAHALRMVEDVIHAASIRSVLQLLDCAKARAFLKGREFVMPEDISSLAPGVLAHRLCFRSGEVSALKRKEIVRYVLERVDTPK